MKSITIKKIFFYTLLLSLLPSTIIAGTPNYPTFTFDPESLQPAQPIKQECKRLALDQTIKQQLRPEIPTDAFINKVVGYAVFDFQLDAEGKVKNIELASTASKTYFVKGATKVLKRLKFSVDQDWISNCAEQKYRIGYAFRIMDPCTGHEFPAPIINICSEGVVQSSITTTIINN